MGKTKLVFFEGIAGSGKSTTSQNVSKTLSKADFPHRLLREVDKDNPFVINDVPSDGRKYCELSSTNWDNFICEYLPNNNVWLMDNAFLQYPINALVWIDYPREKIVDHIALIHSKLDSFDLQLIYFHGNSVREEVKRVLDSRGEKWLNKNLKSFVQNPFGKKHKDDPIEGIYSFFEDVVGVYNKAMEALPLSTLRVNKAGLDWPKYESEIIEFLVR